MDQHLTAYHIKDEFAKTFKDSLESLLRKPEDVSAFDPTAEMPFKTKLFVLKPKEEPKLTQPSWVEFLKPGFGELKDENNRLVVPKTQSTGAVLFVKIPYEDKEELFAFTFGGGRHLLNPKSYDGDYGLHVALNVIYDYAGGTVAPNRLKSVASTTHAANTIRTRKQTDRKATFEAFGVDTQNDDLDAVTGTPSIKTGFWIKQLSGSESLSTNPNVDLEEIGNYCKEIADTYRKDTYKDDFEWIDKRKPVEDPGLLEKLLNRLIETIRDKSDDIVLTTPEITEFEDVDYSYLSFNDRDKFWDLDEVKLIDKLTEAGIDGDLDMDHLEKEWELVTKDAKSNEVVSWPLIDCLSGEIKLADNANETYILSEGKFFEISNDFLQELNKFVESLPLKAQDFLPCCSEATVEGDYNAAAATAKSMLLLDKKTVRLRGRTTPIEICDLLTSDGCFIHVKRKLSSSSLSHLFSQGFVSAELLLMSQKYREAVLAKIREEIGGTSTTVTGAPSYITEYSFSPGEINPRDFEVSYAIIAKWDNKSLVERLPFFSKVNLRRFAENLRRMGFKVSVARINTP